MAYLIDLKSFTDKRGNLTVIEKSMPFEIKRIFYIYGVDGSSRGGHRHKAQRLARKRLPPGRLIAAGIAQREAHGYIIDP